MIRQEIKLAAPVEKIYNILTDSQHFSEMTGGAPAKISAVEGAEFSCFGGMIHGRNIELVENQRIILAWRAKPWKQGLYSMVSFELIAEGGQTRLILTHTGFAEDQQQHLAQGWQDNYWQPMQQYLQR
ncbi:MAG: SRPBCC domain-containing protein [Pseudomonadales bacterium]|nr:SRPBCC domain-containing protein [Pseudomonadales bacterium]